MKTTTKLLTIIAFCQVLASCNLVHCPKLDKLSYKNKFSVKRDKSVKKHINAEIANNDKISVQNNSTDVLLATNSNNINFAYNKILIPINTESKSVILNITQEIKTVCSVNQRNNKTKRSVLERVAAKKMKSNIKNASINNSNLESIKSTSNSDNGITLMIVGGVMMLIVGPVMIYLFPILSVVLLLGGLILFLIGLVKFLDYESTDDGF